MTDETWHIPFAGRLESGVYGQNFLFQYENVYVMDNHRAAYWCWLQEVDALQPFNILHIDRHYDCLGITNTWLEGMPDVTQMTLQEYLDFEVPMDANTGNMRLFRWDSYLSLCLLKHESQLSTFWCATHDDGAKPPITPTDSIEAWELPGALGYLNATDQAPWICNIDLDYYFYSCEQKVTGKWASQEYMRRVFGIVRDARAAGTIRTVTLCLSPECCGGWPASEELARLACEELEVPFPLPSE